MNAFKNVLTLMDRTHVLVEVATDLTWMGTAVQVKI